MPPDAVPIAVAIAARGFKAAHVDGPRRGERNARVSTNVLPAMRPASPVLLATLALLAACSSKQDKQLAAVKSAHSVTAEWAAIESLAARSRLTRTYVHQMRDEARTELKSSRREATPPAARAIDAVQGAPAGSAALLAASARRLDAEEKKLEAR